MLPIDQILATARKATPAQNAKIPPLLQEYDRIPDRLRWSRRALIAFEFWNLLVIVASLVGFNYVSAWAGAWWLSGSLAAVAVLTALITVGSVWVWTRGIET